jgi:hypothetical protein
MPKFIDYFKTLVSDILGGIPKDEDDVNKSLDEIDERLNRTSYGNLFEMIANAANKRTKTDKPIKITDILDKNDNYEDQINDLFARRAKYSTYRQMIKKVSRLERAVKVFRSNIISADNLKNQILNFTPLVEGDLDKEIVTTKERFRYLKLNKHKSLSRVIDNSLKYGDYFIEIAVNDALFKKEKLLESKNNSLNIDENIEFKKKDKTFLKNIKFNVTLTKNEEDQSILAKSDEKTILTESNSDDDISLEDLTIIYHKPHNVIKLTLGDMIYGYIIVPENIIKTKLLFEHTNILKSPESFVDLTKKMGLEYTFAQQALERSKRITDKIIDHFKEVLDNDVIEENDTLKSLIGKLITSSIFSAGISTKHKDIMDGIDTVNISNMKFRFVDPSRMQEFVPNLDEYDPYGTSIFDNVIFDSSLLISDKITSSIERLTKSIERRIVNFETEDRNSTAMIQILKEKFRKKKALFDGRTSFDNIPSLISPFEEYYIPTRDGTPYINFTSETPTSTHQARVDDMKFKRDEIVSDLNIPPAYIGLEENVESKATLFLQNILFSIEIMDYQETYSEAYTELNEKIGRILGDEKIGVIKVGFARPVILSSASELEHLSIVSGVKDFLYELGLDADDIRDRYLPFFADYFNSTRRTSKLIKKMEHGEEGNKEETEAF